MPSLTQFRSAILFARGLPFVVGLASAFAADTQPATLSLLPESSLETANAAGTWPAGWGSARHVTWESENGNHFFHITADPGRQTGLYMSAPITKDVRAVELTFRTRVTGLERGEQNYFDARVIINFKDAAGKRTPPPKLPYFNQDTDGWVPVILRMKVPDTAVLVELMPCLFKVTAGNFDIDDIALRPIDPAQVD